MWRKEKTRKGLLRWTNDAGRWIYVTSTISTRGEKIYMVDSNHPLYYSSASFFNTRDKAVVHAEDFMRRHPESSTGEIIFSQDVDLRTMRKF